MVVVIIVVFDVVVDVVVDNVIVVFLIVVADHIVPKSINIYLRILDAATGFVRVGCYAQSISSSTSNFSCV